MTVSSEPVTVKLFRISSKDITDTLVANLSHSTAKPSRFAEFAMISFGVEQAFQADSSVGIAIARVFMVPVVTAIARHTGSSRDFRVAKIVISTD